MHQDLHDSWDSARTNNASEWRKSLKGIGLFCLRIMSEIQYESYYDAPNDIRESMDNLVGPQHYAIAPVTDIAKHWLAFIRKKRNSHSRNMA